MSLICLKTNDMTWQDRTMNVELMLAPSKSVLLYNKHKGLQTKYRQESTNLEREKSSYLRSFQTEQRLMERRKEMYSKRRNDIIIRRTSVDARRRSTDGGRLSAPPRLETTNPSKEDSVFLTCTQAEVRRESKSADPRTKQDTNDRRHRRTPSRATAVSSATPDPMAALSPCPSTRTTPGKPYLERRKSVRFQHLQTFDNKESKSPEPVQLTIEQKIQKFMETQNDFNNRKLEPNATPRDRVFVSTGNRPAFQKRYSGLQLNMMKLEDAFDEFCADSSSDGLNKLVKLASKMKTSVRLARNSSIVPSTGALGCKALLSNRSNQSVRT